jgi:uncharacterized protein involved in type VI secretion and phage assembly
MRATLLAVQKLRPFFPIPRTPKPAMPGVQSAVVVGEPTGDEIYLDPKEYCRVKVKFPWDLDADTTGKNSCWVRVSQNWAGNGFGVQLIHAWGKRCWSRSSRAIPIARSSWAGSTTSKTRRPTRP